MCLKMSLGLPRWSTGGKETRLPVQETRVPALTWEDLMCLEQRGPRAERGGPGTRIQWQDTPPKRRLHPKREQPQPERRPCSYEDPA